MAGTRLASPRPPPAKVGTTISGNSAPLGGTQRHSAALSGTTHRERIKALSGTTHRERIKEGPCLCMGLPERPSKQRELLLAILGQLRDSRLRDRREQLRLRWQVSSMRRLGEMASELHEIVRLKLIDQSSSLVREGAQQGLGLWLETFLMREAIRLMRQAIRLMRDAISARDVPGS